MPAPVFQGAQVILHSGAAIRGPLRCHYYCQEFTEVNLHQMIFFQTLYGSIAKNDCPIYIYIQVVWRVMDLISIVTFSKPMCKNLCCRFV